jgi:hypothetical protein
MIIQSQITADGSKMQQQVNGYSPKLDENQSFSTSKMNGYSPKSVAESAAFYRMGGYSPKSVAAAAQNSPIYTLLYGFGVNICQNVTFFYSFTIVFFR